VRGRRDKSNKITNLNVVAVWVSRDADAANKHFTRNRHNHIIVCEICSIQLYYILLNIQSVVETCKRNYYYLHTESIQYDDGDGKSSKEVSDST
jgi:hypothetical protein